MYLCVVAVMRVGLELTRIIIMLIVSDYHLHQILLFSNRGGTTKKVEL